MSSPQPDRPTANPPRRPSRVASVLLILLGVVMLLPGICSIFFIIAMPGVGGSSVGALWLICFAISAGGVWLITYALRPR